MSNSKEIRSLTGIRGIAALYVALYHNLEIIGYTGESKAQIFINHGYLSVDLFFVLSGFVMALSSKRLFDGPFSLKDYLLFMSKRFARIYPMYLLVICGSFVFVNHFNGIINFIVGLSLLTIVSGREYVITHLWSLSTEWIAYLFFPALVKITHKFNSPKWMTLLVLVAVSAITYAYILKSDLVSKSTGFAIFPVPALIRCFAEYILGILACKFFKDYQGSHAPYRLFALTSFLSIVLLLCFRNVDVLVIVLFVILVTSISTDNGVVASFFASKPIYFLGLISYSLYLIHPLVLVFGRQNGYHLGSTLGILVYVAVLIPLSYLCFKFIELPMQIKINNKIHLATLGNKLDPRYIAPLPMVKR